MHDHPDKKKLFIVSDISATYTAAIIKAYIKTSETISFYLDDGTITLMGKPDSHHSMYYDSVHNNSKRVEDVHEDNVVTMLMMVIW